MKPCLLFVLTVAVVTTSGVFPTWSSDNAVEKPFYQYLRHPTGYANIDEELARLNRKIIEGTEAERNLPLEFRLLLEANKDKVSDPTLLPYILPKLHTPEDLLVSHETFNPIITAEDLTADSKHFSPINILVNELHTLKQCLDQRLHQNVDELIYYYENSKSKLSAVVPKKRPIMLESRARMSGERLGHWLIKQDIARKIMSKDLYGGRVKSNQDGGQSPVCSLKEVHYKLGQGNTIDPAMEWAMYAFSKLFVDEGAAPSGCLKLENVLIIGSSDAEIKKEFDLKVVNPKVGNRISSEEFFVHYPQHKMVFNQATRVLGYVQASETTGDLSLLNYLKKIESEAEHGWSKLDESSFSATVATDLVTVPCDAKDDNLRVVTSKNGDKTISIDSDRALASMIISEFGKHYIQGKNMRYLMSEPMNWFFTEDVGTRIKSHNANRLVVDWLALMGQQNGLYETYKMSGGEVAVLDEQAIKAFKLIPGMGKVLRNRISLLQEIILNNKLISHQTLFDRMYPVAARYYNALANQQDPKIQELLAEKTPKSVGIQEPFASYGELAAATSVLHSAQQQLYDKVIAIEDLIPDADLLEVIYQRDDYEINRTNEINQEVLDLLTTLASESNTNLLQAVMDLKLSNIGHVINILPHAAVDYFECVDDKGLTFLDYLIQSAYRQKTSQLNADYDKTLLGITRLLELKVGKNFKPENFDYLFETVYANQTWYSLEVEHAFKTWQATSPMVNWLMRFNTIIPRAGGGKSIQVRGNQSTKKQKRYIAGRYLPQLYGKGKWINKHGKRDVGRIECEFGDIYFKKYPAFGSVESLVSAFGHAAFGDGRPYNTLAEIDGEPVLISQGIGEPEDNLQDALEATPDRILDLDPQELFKEFIKELVIMPEDGKPSNKSFVGKAIKGIDNDQCMVPACSRPPKEKNLFHKGTAIVQAKSVTWCLPQMHDKIPENSTELVKVFEQPFELLKNWLLQAQEIHILDQELFSTPQLERFYKDHDTIIGVPFQKGDIGRLAGKLIGIYNEVNSNPDHTYFDIIKKLEPFLYSRYRSPTNNNEENVLERFIRVDGPSYYFNKHNVPQTVKSNEQILPSSTPSGSIIEARDIPIRFATTKEALEGSAVHDPSMALRELKEYEAADKRQALAEASMKMGESNSSIAKLLEGERLTILKCLELRDYEPHTQQMIFSSISELAPEELGLIYSSILTERYLRKLTLKNLKILTLRYCPELKNLGARGVLSSEFPPLHLQELRLSDCPQLESMVLATKQLTVLSVRNCPRLKLVDFSTSNLEELDWRPNNEEVLSLAAREQQLQKLLDGLDSDTVKKINIEGIPITEARTIKLLNKYTRLSVLRFTPDNSNHLNLSIVRQLLPLLRGCSDCTPVVKAYVNLADETKQWVSEFAQQFITDETNGYWRSSIIKTCGEIPVDKRPGLAEVALQFITDEMNFAERASIIKTCCEIPVDKREGLAEVTLQFITDQMSI